MKASRIELRVPAPAREGGDWEIAATVYLPCGGEVTDRPPVLVALPGAGYNRRYFDIPEPGYSEAEHHVGRGAIVVAMDHLGVGESSVPPSEVTTMETVAAANNMAVSAIVERIRSGTLDEATAPYTPSCVVGAGQSMGGHVVVAMQAYHRSFDGVAVLGSSMVRTTMPRGPDQPEVVVPEGTPPDEVALLVIAGTDWTYGFFWEDVPDNFVQTDTAGGPPPRRMAPEWGSVTYPGLGATLMRPGVVAAEAAMVDVPVLLAMGERDVTRSPLEELSAFSGALDLAAVVFPRMAHMHNFAGTRHLLWERLDLFMEQVASAKVAE